MGALNNIKDLLNKNIKYDTGLVLSGGGSRGFAHAGILKALNEFDIFSQENTSLVLQN